MSLIINPYSFATGGSSPGDVLNPELWLRGDFITGLSDGDTITTNWPDGSGNARNATAVQGNTRKPKWLSASGPNSTPCVELISSDAQGGWFTLSSFMTGFTSGEAISVEQRDSDTPGDSFASPVVAGWGSDDDEYFPFTDGKIYDCFGSTVRKTGNNPTTNLTNWITFDVRSASASWVYSILGATTGNDFFSTGTNTVGWTAGTARIGHVNTNDKSIKGRVAEVLMWNRVLDDTTERKAVIHAYLNARYGFSLPT